jgi:hypothetical protein
MDRAENIESLKKTLEILREEEKRLVRSMSLPHSPSDLRERIQANLELLRQVSERLEELQKRP